MAIFLVGLGLVTKSTDSAGANVLYFSAAGASFLLGLLALVIGIRAHPKTTAQKWGIALGAIDMAAIVWGTLAVVLVSCISGTGVACT